MVHRRLRKAALLIASLVAAWLALWLGAHTVTDRFAWARAVAWMESGVDDQHRFPARSIANAPPRFDFRRPDPGERERLAPVWREIELDSGNGKRRVALEEFLRETDTPAFLVVRNDVLLYEGYFNGGSRETPVTSFSVAKSFVSALIGGAVADGHIRSVHDPVTRYVPELLQRDARYRHVTLEHLLTTASGIRYLERGMPWSDDALTYYSPDLRATAKFGRLYLNRGRWNGEQILPAEWVDASTRRDAVSDPAEQYQYLWWVDTRLPGRHHFYALGKYGQYIYVMPERGLVFVRFGRSDPHRRWPMAFEAIAGRIERPTP